jgi:pimeloyl-ACP methyl ester carboxylesterase
VELPLVLVGGEHSVPKVGDAPKSYFADVTLVPIPKSACFVPEEQPEALADVLKRFFNRVWPKCGATT